MIEALPGRSNLARRPLQPSGLVALFAEVPQHVGRQVERLVQSEAARRNGDYWVRGKVRTPRKRARDPEAAKRLWELSVELSGATPPA